MRLLVAFFLLLPPFLLAAEADPIQILKESQENRDKLVPAIRALSSAITRAEKANDEVKAAELNACLFWARKRLNLQEAYALAKDAPEANQVADAVILKKVGTSQAQRWLARADGYAANQPDPLLKAIRYFEVAHRFQGTAEGFKAMEKSLALMQEAKVSTGETEAAPDLTEEGFGKQEFDVEVTTSERLGDGWSVFVDGTLVSDKAGKPAVTPCTIRLPEGNHQVAVARGGFVDPYGRKVTVQNGAENVVAIKGLVPARPGRSRLMMLAYGKYLGQWVEQEKPPKEARVFTVELSKSGLTMKNTAAGTHSLESVRLSESGILFRWSAQGGSEAFKMEVKGDGRTALFSHYTGSPEIVPGMTRPPARAGSVGRFMKR